jgi:signal transduction histidine kinase
MAMSQPLGSSPFPPREHALKKEKAVQQSMDYIPQSAGLPASLGQAMAHMAETFYFHAELTEQRRRLEQSNQELHRRNAELQSFYHILSHELKTPLTAAREFVSIVLEGLAGPLSETQREYLGLVKDSCDQITLGLNDLLDATRVDTGKLSVAPRPTPMDRVVTQAMAAMASTAQGKGIRLQQVIAPRLPDVLIDERRIAQVLVNLLSNALKFTPAGGEVTVKVSDDPQWPAQIRVSVSDTGRGIPPADLGQIFDQLYQIRRDDATVHGGLGLGLYISQEVVKLHGGEIWAESTLGKGSTFSFTVPKHGACDTSVQVRKE